MQQSTTRSVVPATVGPGLQVFECHVAGQVY